MASKHLCRLRACAPAAVCLLMAQGVMHPVVYSMRVKGVH